MAAIPTARAPDRHGPAPVLDAPAQILEVKQAILRADATDLTPKVLRLLKLDDPDRVREAVEKL